MLILDEIDGSLSFEGGGGRQGPLDWLSEYVAASANPATFKQRRRRRGERGRREGGKMRKNANIFLFDLFRSSRCFTTPCSSDYLYLQ